MNALLDVDEVSSWKNNDSITIMEDSRVVIDLINGKNNMQSISLLQIVEKIKKLKKIMKKYFLHIYKELNSEIDDISLKKNKKLIDILSS